MRKFETGATRNVDDSKLDYEGFLSPLVMRRFAEFMHKNRQQADGNIRASDNWQKGIPFDSYMKSGFRHFHDWWTQHRGNAGTEDLETALCALIFNAQGYLHELLQHKQSTVPPPTFIPYHEPMDQRPNTTLPPAEPFIHILPSEIIGDKHW